MALTVQDILRLPCASTFQLLTGTSGLSKPIHSAEILDYEFSVGVECDSSDSFTHGSIVISSLLFAKDDTELLLQAIEELVNRDASALIYKKVIYDTLPEEVVAFAQSRQFPIFSYTDGTWFENIIFEITEAIRNDDSSFLTEEYVDKMVRGDLGKESMYQVSHGISLRLKDYSAAVYLQSDALIPERIENLYYHSKGLKVKCLPVPHKDGLFMLFTANTSSKSAFDAIFREAADILGMSHNTATVWSGIHLSHEKFGEIFQEAYYGWLAATTTGINFSSYSDIGIYQLLIPLADSPAMISFSSQYEEVILEYKDTCAAWIKYGGDATATSIALHCHANTIHYRLNRIKERIGYPEYSDSQLFRDLSIAFGVLSLRH